MLPNLFFVAVILASSGALAEAQWKGSRTIDGLMNDGRIPTFIIYKRLCALFGPDFDAEVETGRATNVVELRAPRDGRRA